MGPRTKMQKELTWVQESGRHLVTPVEGKDGLHNLLTKSVSPFLLFVYSPDCGYSVRGARVLQDSLLELQNTPRHKQLLRNVFRYNAVSSSDIDIVRKAHQNFEHVFGFPIEHYPTMVVVSAKGDILEFTQELTAANLKNLYAKLKRT